MTVEAERAAARCDVEAYRAAERTIAWACRYRWRQHLQRAYAHAALAPWVPFNALVPTEVPS